MIELFVGLMIGVITIVAILLMPKNTADTKNYLTSLAASLHANLTESKYTTGGTVSGEFSAGKYECLYYPGGRRDPPEFTVILYAGFPADVTIRDERSFDKIAKDVKLSTELQTDDRVFDDRYFIDADDPDALKAFFHEESVRLAVRTIFSINESVANIELKEQSVKVFFSSSPFKGLTSEQVTTCLESLRILLRNASLVSASAPSSRIPLSGPSMASGLGVKSFRAVSHLFTAMAITVLVGGGVLSLLGSVIYQPFRYGFALTSLQYSIPCFCLYIYSCYRVVRGKSSSHRVLATAFLAGLAGFIITGFGWMITANGFLDESVPVSHIVSVADKYTSKRTSTTDYYIEFLYWGETGADNRTSLSVSSSFYNRVQKGAKIKLLTKTGYFNQEWVMEYRLVD